MIKLFIGGSPCTFWSIAQKNNRETEPGGFGWELFENYLIAKEKFKPNFFLYENNKSASKAIKDEIKNRLNVWDGSFLTEDTGVRYIEINSALVSAQNRQRFYVHNCGDVEQPEDRGILLRDVLESGVSWIEKSYALTTRCAGAIPEDTIKRKRHTMVADPVCVAQRGRYSDTGNRNKKSSEKIEQYYEARLGGKTNALTTVQKDNLVAEPIIFQTPRGKNNGGCKYGKCPTMTANGSFQQNNHVIEPIRIGDIGSTAQAHRVYSCDGKSVTINAGGGGQGGKTGLYTCPYDKVKGINNKTVPIYEVHNGFITIKGKQYPIKLADGFYIIRKLTVTECCRLQTLPDDYCRAVSASQGYKGLGNGWTAEVIIHILNGAMKDVPRDEKIVVLSMYDGIGTGRYCLDKMGFTNVEYYASEIDKYAMQIAKSNYPDIRYIGDAFQVRDENWRIDYGTR